MDLNIFYFNIDKISVQDLKHFNKQIDTMTDYHLIVLCETRNPRIDVKNFNVINMTTITVLIKKDIAFKVFDSSYSSISFQFVFNNIEFNCHAAYWSPGNNMDKCKVKSAKFKNHLTELTRFYKTNSTNFILIGDLNLKWHHYLLS